MSSLGAQLYLRFPAFRDLGATLHGLLVNRRRYGPVYRASVREVDDRARWTHEQLGQYQSRRLLQLLAAAAGHVPYYRELFASLGCEPGDLATASGWMRLPILEKEALRKDALAFVDERLPRDALLSDSTSGTTGTPVTTFRTRRAEQEHYAYFEARCRRPAGLRFGVDPWVIFGAKTVVPRERSKPPFWCYNHAARQLYMSVFHLAPRFLGFYCDELRKRPYRALLGYPSALSTLARFVIDESVHGLRIPIAITSGETLLPFQRQEIERAFGCHVFDQYGSSELACFAAECRYGRMHVSTDYGVVEIVDDQGLPVPPGQPGHLIATGLINEAQPLLRYRTGDLAAWSADACPCASPFPVLDAIQGRTSHALVLADGRLVCRIGEFAESIHVIRECQIVQERVGHFHILVVAEQALAEAERQLLIRNLKASIGPAEVDVLQVDGIPRGPSGKFAFIESKVPNSARTKGQAKCTASVS